MEFFASLGVVACVIVVIIAVIYAVKFILKIMDMWEEQAKRARETGNRLDEFYTWLDKLQSQVDDLEPIKNDRPKPANQPHPEHWSDTPPSV